MRNPCAVPMLILSAFCMLSAGATQSRAGEPVGFLFEFGRIGSGDAEFFHPVGVTVDGSDRIIVADRNNQRIQIFGSSGDFLAKFRGPLYSPGDVATDSMDRILVSDETRRRVYVFDPSGNLLFEIPVGSFYPVGVAVDSADRIIVAEQGFNDHRIEAFDSSGHPLWNVYTDYVPYGVAVDGMDRILVSARYMTGSSYVKIYDSSGNLLSSFRPRYSFNPLRLAVDGAQRIIVTDGYYHRIQVFDSSGKELFTFGKQGSTPGMFYRPGGIAVDSLDRYVVCDGGNHRIQVLWTDLQGTGPPETDILSAVDGDGAALAEGGMTLSDSAAFTFEGRDIDGVAGFECSLDGETFSGCESPRTFTGLAVDAHAFEVRTIDTLGNVDPTPAAFTWAVVSPAELILALIDEIGSLGLSHGAAVSLGAPLSNAVAALEDGDPADDVSVCNRLDAFTNHVDAQDGKKLPRYRASELRQSADAIRWALDCAGPGG
ncbi:MAG: hypothetical protein ABII00_04655 [Elusimicrobiota bacterium]